MTHRVISYTKRILRSASVSSSLHVAALGATPHVPNANPPFAKKKEAMRASFKKHRNPLSCGSFILQLINPRYKTVFSAING